MSDDCRVFICQWCREVAAICRECDLGNQYCSKECAAAGRRASKLRASLKYQDTRPGRLHHAARQQRYRERLKQKVTRQGRKATSRSGTRGSVPRDALAAAMEAALRQVDATCCHCGRVFHGGVRLGYVQSPDRPPFFRYGSGDVLLRAPP